MSTSTKFQTSVQSIKELPGNVIRFISGAVARIFGLDDDNYPKTGVQPFEGDPAGDDK
jgi:hypothetical protein